MNILDVLIYIILFAYFITKLLKKLQMKFFLNFELKNQKIKQI